MALIFLVRLICLAFLACLALLFYAPFLAMPVWIALIIALIRLSVSCLYRGNEGMEKTKALILSSAFFLV